MIVWPVQDRSGTNLTTDQQREARGSARGLPLLRDSGFPTAFSHIFPLIDVGTPCHHSFRSSGFLCTTFQSGKICFSQICAASSARFSRASRRCSATLRFCFSAENQVTRFVPRRRRYEALTSRQKRAEGQYALDPPKPQKTDTAIKRSYRNETHRQPYSASS